MLIQGCSGLDPSVLLSSAGNPAMLANLKVGFSLPGSPSGEVEKVIFYADATNVMSENLIEQQQVVVDELAAALGYKNNEKTAEQLAEFMNTVDGNSLTPSQKHTITRLAPEVAGLTKVGAITLLSAGNLALALKPAYEKVQNDTMLLLEHGNSILGSFNDMASIAENVTPVIDGFANVNDSLNNLASAAGIAKLSPAEEKAAEKKALKSTAGSEAELDF